MIVLRRSLLTASRLRELLVYEPDTGLFRYRVPRGPMKVGAVAGTRATDGGIDIFVDYTQNRAHRLAWLYMTGEWPKQEVDHRDGIRTNNAWANLRDVTPTVNKQNIRRAPKNKKHSPLLGAQKTNRAGLWKATIKVNGKRIALGCYRSDQAAHEAYIEAKRRLHPGCTI